MNRLIAKKANASEAKWAIDALVTAFSADPMARWHYPHPGLYLEYSPSFYFALGGNAFKSGTARILDGYIGTALWLPPGVGPDENALEDVFNRTLGAQVREDLLGCFEQMEKYHPKEPHWHLPLIGVDPAHTGKGGGAALMRDALAACDSDEILAYLESTNARNIPFYNRLGFEVIGTIQSGGSPELFAMLRVPK